MLYVSTEAENSTSSVNGSRVGPTFFNFSFLATYYTLHRLIDWYEDLRADTEDSWLPLIEQLVCARARIFLGTRKSTFSGYIHRMRGYMLDVRQKTPLFHDLHYPHSYQSEVLAPSWAGGFRAAVHHFDFLETYPETWEDTVAPFF